METVEGLNQLIHRRLIEKNGNVKLTENNDIVEYGKALGIPESQLIFKIIDVTETIDWAEVEKKKQQEKTSREEILNSTATSANTKPTTNIVYCTNCNAANEKGVANFCEECGSELKPEPQSQPVYVPEPVYEQNRYVETEPEASSRSKAPIFIGIFSVIAVLVLGYFFWGKDYLRDKNATRMYSFANSLALRSSPAGGGDYNMIGNIPYGSEVLVYDNGVDWVNCKLDGQEGYASPKYLLNKMDFQELNAILADVDTRTAVSQTRFKKALLNYFRDNNLIGKMDVEMQKEVYGTVTTREVWQLFAKAETNNSNTVYFSKKSKQSSKFNDFACIIKNNTTNERKILIFSFDDNESPKLEAEDAAPANGYIANVQYDYDSYGNISLTPMYTSW
ncbi:SH3 domain-containing protein [Flavobacterium gillisiae]|jgi:hypothetical protein|uniref:SH3 domain-containing protein n=1 Tax=Flavobacterium gillisiae TaxID=150146 RepID=A0A1H4GC90_9FLAO|nr:hypothetical protein [Flavobacterium gillisiae]SEB06518.1 SH3 domain-containing protein [Flavobacterium gillisiae]